ncbi:hypothetical protein B6U90_02835 [Thermoplasmatales archaeon ex4484_6]|nr:MAG: hypothetical protein B6U90_02835 [Thermoplasmatales archaeon ex4484_6]RLF69654.1 MAG: hypothetical protein DRN57_00095 [Thermoplasmata archaeon]
MTKGEEAKKGSWYNRASVQVARTVKTTLINRWMFLAVPILLIPFFIALYTVIDPPDLPGQWPEAFYTIGILIYLQILLLMFTLIYGTAMLNDEIRSRNIVYLFTRASRRFEVLLYKFVGTFISLFLLFSVSAVLTFFTFSLHTSTGNMWDHLPMLAALEGSLALGLLVYLALFSFIGVIFRWPLVAGLILSFFWEVFMVNIPLNISQLTIMYYIRSIFLSTHMVRVYSEGSKRAGLSGAMMVLLVLTAVFLAFSSAAISRKDVN